MLVITLKGFTSLDSNILQQGKDLNVGCNITVA